jgi:SAM-dependent methyltransferase
MTQKEFKSFGDSIASKLGDSNKLHGYFEDAAPRLFYTCYTFGLLETKSLGRVLEIGPFYGYVPFLLRNQSTSYTVVEGPEPAVDPLLPLYGEANIDVQLLDFFEIFGPVNSATHRLPFPDNSFDTIICWETMEHFNFNPVKFVRELFRVCAPGGKVHITVPNKASFQALAGLWSRRKEPATIQSYYQFEDYHSAGKTAFYGFHWREYTPEELSALFSKVSFKIAKCRTAVMLHQHKQISLKRKLLRFVNKCVGSLAPRHGTNVLLTAVK